MVAESWDVHDLLQEAPTPQRLTSADVEALADELAAYYAHFAPLFRRSEQRAGAARQWRGSTGKTDLCQMPREHPVLSWATPAVTATPCSTVACISPRNGSP